MKVLPDHREIKRLKESQGDYHISPRHPQWRAQIHERREQIHEPLPASQSGTLNVFSREFQTLGLYVDKLSELQQIKQGLLEDVAELEAIHGPLPCSHPAKKGHIPQESVKFVEYCSVIIDKERALLLQEYHRQCREAILSMAVHGPLPASLARANQTVYQKSAKPRLNTDKASAVNKKRKALQALGVFRLQRQDVPFAATVYRPLPASQSGAYSRICQPFFKRSAKHGFNINEVVAGSNNRQAPYAQIHRERQDVPLNTVYDPLPASQFGSNWQLSKESVNHGLDLDEVAAVSNKRKTLHVDDDDDGRPIHAKMWEESKNKEVFSDDSQEEAKKHNRKTRKASQYRGIKKVKGGW